MTIYFVLEPYYVSIIPLHLAENYSFFSLNKTHNQLMKYEALL